MSYTIIILETTGSNRPKLKSRIKLSNNNDFIIVFVVQ